MTGADDAAIQESVTVRKSDVAVDTAALAAFMGVAVLFAPEVEGLVWPAVYMFAYAAVLWPACGTWADRLDAVGWLP